MRRDMKLTIFFFTVGTACWTPFIWHEIPLVKAWKADVRQREQAEHALQLIRDRHAMQQRQLHRLMEDVRKMTRTVEEIEAAKQEGGDQEPDASDAEPATVPSEPACIVTLYTADKSWTCGPCNQQKKYLNQPPSFDYDVIESPSGGRSPHNRYPCWVIKRPDGTMKSRTGAMNPKQLEEWYSKEAK